MHRSDQSVPSVFLVVGLALVGGAAYLGFRSISFQQRAAVAEGKVIELVASRSDDGITYRPRVEYQKADGVRRIYQPNIWSSSPGLDVGDRVDVLYDPEAPGEVRIRAFMDLWLVPAWLLGGGTVFGGIGGVALAARWRVNRRRADLLLHGRRIVAKLQSIERNAGAGPNGRHPWRILCLWVDPTTGLLHRFRSEKLWLDPRPHVRGDQLTVFVDPRDPRRYLVDVSFMPRPAA